MLKAIETLYKGYRMRSRTEGRWATFLDALGLSWDYEAEGYDLGGVWYLPDFWLPDLDLWVETKGEMPSEQELEKAESLATQSGKCVVVLWGAIPWPGPDFSPQSLLFASLDGRVSMVAGTYWCQCPTCHAISLGKPCVCGSLPRFDSPHLLDAYEAARSARFEQRPDHRSAPGVKITDEAAHFEHLPPSEKRYSSGTESVGEGKCRTPRIPYEEKKRTIFVSSYGKTCIHCKQAIVPGEYYILAQSTDGSSNKHHCMNCCAFSSIAIKDAQHREALNRSTALVRGTCVEIEISRLLSEQANTVIRQFRDLGITLSYKYQEESFAGSSARWPVPGEGLRSQIPTDVWEAFLSCRGELVEHAKSQAAPFIGKNMPGKQAPTAEHIQQAKDLLARLQELHISVKCRKGKVLLHGDVPTDLWFEIAECQSALVLLVPPSFHAGDCVVHEKFGQGTVIKSEMESGSEYTEVAFKDKTLRFCLDYAPLKKVDRLPDLEAPSSGSESLEPNPNDLDTPEIVSLPSEFTIIPAPHFSAETNATLRELHGLGFAITYKDGELRLVPKGQTPAEIVVPRDMWKQAFACQEEVACYLIGQPGSENLVSPSRFVARELLNWYGNSLEQRGGHIFCADGRPITSLLREFPESIWGAIEQEMARHMRAKEPRSRAEESRMEDSIEIVEVSFHRGADREKITRLVQGRWQSVLDRVRAGDGGTKLADLLGEFAVARVEEGPTIVLQGRTDFFCSVLQRNKRWRECVNRALDDEWREKCKICVIGPDQL